MQLFQTSQALAVFSHFYAGDKGQITDVNINFHVFSRNWEGGRQGGGLTGLGRAVECVCQLEEVKTTSG